MMTNEQILAYYIGLLIMQYSGSTAIQTITFSAVPASGNFNFIYGTVTSPAIAWNASNPTIVGVLESLTGYTVTITSGSLSVGTLTISFGNQQALILGTTNSTLEDGSSNEITTITSGDLVKAAGTIQALSRLTVMNQLPLTVQNAFNLIPTIQTITFSSAPSTGYFTIIISVTSSPSLPLTSLSINYNDDNQTIQNAIDAILPSGNVTVTGGLSDGSITLTFSAVNPSIISIPENTYIFNTSAPCNVSAGAFYSNNGNFFTITSTLTNVITITSTGISDPLSSGTLTRVSGGGDATIAFDAFSSSADNTTGIQPILTTNIAYGSQLDTVGKYVGVTRYGSSSSGPITLNDSDFYQLIQLGIIVNNFGSSLAQIQSLLFTFFQGHILVFDYQNMQMSYVINGGFFSIALVDCFITQRLLPKPMGVLLASVIVVPDAASLFSFRTYFIPSTGSPFNDYPSYNLNYPWVTYSNAVGL